jgi:hypothetical protein
MAIANRLLEHLFKAPTERKFLRIEYINPQKTAGRIYEGSELLREDEVKNMSTEARTIMRLTIYEKIMDSLEATAEEMMFKKAKNVDDMMFAKAVLYTVDVIKRKIENIAKLN